MATQKRINPEARAPALIRELQSLGWTQEHLEKVLSISQQSVSNYLLGRVWKERYDIIMQLREMVEKKITPQRQ